MGYCLGVMGQVRFDYNKRLIISYVIQLSGGHCECKFSIFSSIFLSDMFIYFCKNLDANLIFEVTKKNWAFKLVCINLKASIVKRSSALCHLSRLLLHVYMKGYNLTNRMVQRLKVYSRQMHYTVLPPFVLKFQYKI